MEEILLSIRQIIADDQALFARGVAASDDAPNSAVSNPAVSSSAGPKAAADPALEDAARAAIDAGREAHLLSPAAGASVASAFNALAAARVLRNSDALAALTQDLLRPMLKAWLDDNLPALVERLVRAEIERVARED